MTRQAVLFEKIEKLPPQYFEQVFDFVGYIEQKAKRTEIEYTNASPNEVMSAGDEILEKHLPAFEALAK